MKIQLLLPISIFLLLPSLCLAGSKINSKDSAYCEQNSSNIIDCLIKKQGDTKTALNKAYNQVYKMISYEELAKLLSQPTQL